MKDQTQNTEKIKLKKGINMVPTIQVDVANTTFNHHWYGLS